MASLEPKSPYSRYSPYSRDPTDLPSRSRVFSQLDNIAPNQSRPYPSEHTKTTQNTDRIAQIKKKYDKLLNKSVSKPQNTYECPPKDYNRSVTKAPDSKSDYPTRPNGYSHEGENLYSKGTENPVTPTKTESYGKDHYGGQNKQLKSQLDCNRSALTQMKSQLQARLNELSTKTIMNSALRKQQQDNKEINIESTQKSENNKVYSKQSYNVVQKTSKQDRKTYDEISQKYSKMGRYTHQKHLEKENQPKTATTVEDRVKDYLPQSYLKKYNNIPSHNEKNRALKPQLSIISEKSNSNKSQSFNHLDFEDISKDSKVESSNVREIINPQYDDIFKKESQQKQTYQDKKWLKSTYSYFEEKPTLSLVKHQKSSSNHDPTQDNSLYKLQQNVGPIKRTQTEENFSNFKKPTLITSEVQDKKEILTNNYINCSHPKEKYEYLKQNVTHQNDIKEATFGKKVELTDKHFEGSSVNKQTGLPSNDEISKLKEKYSPIPSGSTRENPYRDPEKKNGWKNYQFRDNKDLSSKIDKIDQRIKQIQANKRNLNINFRPYQAAKSTPKYIKNEHQHETKQNLLDKYSIKASVVPPKQVQSVKEENTSFGRPRISSYLDRVKPMYSESTVPQATKSHSNGFSIKLHPVEISNEEDTIPNCNIGKSQSQWKTKMEIQSRTDYGIEERKKKRQEKFEISNNIKSLVTILGQQAVYDQVFRNNKIWFASENKDQKWEVLQNQLKSASVNLTPSEIKEEFQLLESENNPFFSVSDNKCDIKSLVKSYVQAQKHWKQKVSKKFMQDNLEKEGFTSQKLDLDKKGFILIEDLVRFLNIQSGTFLRNRDVSIIFKRINKKNQKTNFHDILSAICL